MSNITAEKQQRREVLIKAARATAEKAQAENRDLTTTEQQDINGKLAEVKSLNEWLSGAVRSRNILAQLDGQAAEAAGISSGGHVGLTGRHAKAMANQFVAKFSEHGQKGLVAAGSQVVSTILLPEIAVEGKPLLSVIDALPSRIVPSPNYSFLQSVAPRQPNAKIVEPGAAKPVTPVQVRAVENKLAVFATLSEPLDTYVLEDGGDNLSQFVSSELLYALQVALADEVVNGDGTPGHFRGLLSTSGILSQSFAVDVLTSVRKGLSALETAGYEADVILMSNSDFEALDLMSARADSISYRSLPLEQSERRLWGTRVVVSHNLPAKTAVILGAGSCVLDHDGTIALKFSDSHGDSFAKNQVVARAESRWGLSVLQPGACVRVATAA